VNLWKLLKDIVLTGLGVAAILSQILSLRPNGLVLGTGLALTVPSVASHVRALLPGPGDGDSSESRSPPSPPPSSPSAREESAGERPAK
jgi:hypothetical protein